MVGLSRNSFLCLKRIGPKIPGQAQFFLARGLRTRSLWARNLWEVGFCVDPPLRRESSQGRSSAKELECEGEIAGKTDEVNERQCLWSVSGAARDET